ncbi:hypothetical protein [Salmonella phage vB_SalS_TU03]|nr:hypothetical protein [Salmonella phage vB_SalS_TU03]
MFILHKLRWSLAYFWLKVNYSNSLFRDLQLSRITGICKQIVCRHQHNRVLFS